MAIVKGIHHVSLKCVSDEQYRSAVSFYSDVIGLPVKKIWQNADGECIMLDTGRGIVEVLHGAVPPKETGIIEHFAFACDDVDAAVKACSNVGCPVTVAPKDVDLAGYKARIAFVIGPCGEQIEFFAEK